MILIFSVMLLLPLLYSPSQHKDREFWSTDNHLQCGLKSVGYDRGKLEAVILRLQIMQVILSCNTTKSG